MALNIVLSELGLSALIGTFEHEHINEEIAMSLTDSELARLGLETIGDRHRFRAKLKALGHEATGMATEDYGGPRKEFFRLILKAIKEKYFDNGLRELLQDDCRMVGIVFALSILQNGKMPTFMNETVLEELWKSVNPSSCIEQLRRGLDTLGIFELMTQLPSLQFLFHPTPVTLTLKRLMIILKAVFSENGSNRLTLEKEVYAIFVKYVREVASGRRGSVSLGHILQFATGTDEEPMLGFTIHPSIQFVEVEANSSFIATANTCINCMKLPRPSLQVKLPADSELFSLYDYAFLNSFYSLI